MLKAATKTIVGILFLALSLTLICPNINYAHENDEKIDGSRLTNLSESEGVYLPLVRGTYLKGGTSRLADIGGGIVALSGSTTAYVTVNTISVSIFIERYSNGTWKYMNSWVANKSNDYVVTKNLNISVSKGSYYRAKGSHTIIKGSKKEVGNSVTDGILIN